MVVLQEPAISWVRNFNPLIPHGSRWPTRNGIYEPMMFYNPMTSAWEPWLATHHRWSEDATELQVDLRAMFNGPIEDLTVEDVVFIWYLQTHPGLDTAGL